MDLKERNEKVEGLLNYLEDEKRRLQDKVELMLADGRFSLHQWIAVPAEVLAADASVSVV